MSSFRPDAHVEAPAFIPLSLCGDSISILVDGSASPASEFVSEIETPAFDSEASGDGAPTLLPEDLAAIEQAAFDRGVEAARGESSRLDDVCEALEAAARKVEAAAKSSVASNRDLVLLLAVEIAQRWVGSELRTDTALLGAALDRAIVACEPSSGIRLELHVDDVARLEAAEAERVAAWRESRGIEIVVAVDLEPGAFRVEAGTAHIDGRPESIVAGLRDALAEAFEAEWPEGVE